MAKARVGLYSVKGDTLTRTHKFCPKCGPGTFLAEHANRLSCGKCGYSEAHTAVAKAPEVTKPVGKPKAAKPAPPAPAAA